MLKIYDIYIYTYENMCIYIYLATLPRCILNIPLRISPKGSHRSGFWGSSVVSCTIALWALNFEQKPLPGLSRPGKAVDD